MEPWQIHAVHKAAAIAAQAHDGQYRKDGKTPYLTHPARVAGLVQAFGGGYLEVIAAWLHDVIEEVRNGETTVAYGLSSLKLPGDDAILIYKMITALTRDRSLSDDEQLLDSMDGDLGHYIRGSVVVLTRLFGRAVEHGYGEAHETLRLCLEGQLPPRNQ
jgi:hypothetical protein